MRQASNICWAAAHAPATQSVISAGMGIADPRPVSATESRVIAKTNRMRTLTCAAMATSLRTRKKRAKIKPSSASTLTGRRLFSLIAKARTVISTV